MSVRKQTITYGAVAIAIAASLLVGSLFIAPSEIIGRVTSPTTSTKSSMSGATAAFAVFLTDPPVVPTGTTSLNLRYANLLVHFRSTDNTQSKWVSTNASGTVNLLKLINISKTLAIAKILNGSVVDEVTFSIVSVAIVVNDTSYNVTTVNSKLEIPVSGQATIYQLGGALIDFSPRVTEIIPSNSSTPIFILVPSATAFGKSGNQVLPDQIQVGHEENLSSEDKVAIGRSFGNLSITSGSLSVSGNSSNLSVTVRNDGDASVALTAISLKGPFNATLTSTACGASASTSMAYESHTTYQSSVTQFTGSGTESGDAIPASDEISNSTYSSTLTNSAAGFSQSNESELLSSDTGGSVSGPTCGETHFEFDQLHEVLFATTNTSTLLPVLSEDGEPASPPLILQPGHSASLSFSGVITFQGGEEEGLGQIAVFPYQHQTYTIYLVLPDELQSSIVVTSA